MGLHCEPRHHKWCPGFANKGDCSSQTCHLPHIDRMAVLGTKNRPLGAETMSAGQSSSVRQGVESLQTPQASKGTMEATNSMSSKKDSFVLQEDFIKL